jgi:hypothetical protein
VNFIRRAEDSGVSSCKNVGSPVSGQRGAGEAHGYPQGLHGAAWPRGNGKRGRKEAEGRKGARGKMGFYGAPFPSSSRPSPAPSAVVPRRQGRRDAGARFYGGHDEDQGGACVHRDDTPVKRAEGHAREKGDHHDFRVTPLGPRCRRPRT